MMSNVIKGLVLVGAVAFWSPSFVADALAYEEAAVTDGATLTGKVTFKGTPPPPKTFDLAKFPQPQFCGKVDSEGGKRMLREVTVKGGALNDVVVLIEGIEKGKPLKYDGTDVKADTCRFLVQGGPSKFVGVAVKKGELRVENMDADPSDPKSVDGVLHNPHGYEVAGSSSSTLFNKPLPTKGMVLKQELKLRKKESFMKLECDQHNFMNVYFMQIANPYYAIVGEDGSFSIDGIPPGKYEVYAWHPILGKMEQEVNLAPKGTASVKFEFTKK